MTLNEEDLKRIEKDRIEINTAYQNGYSKDDLENKQEQLNENDLHDRIDKYGFIHKNKLPAVLSEAELKRNNSEKEREIKWQAMFKDWPKHFSSSKQKYSAKLIRRVYKGIPNSIRNLGWFKLLEVDTQIKAQTGVYERMKNLALQYSLELRQIDVDINRTFRNNCVYKKRYSQRQRQLYNILAAYSVYNTEIGYCQGMSTLTALLLMYISDEERTFWALSQLMSQPKYSMHGFFISGFPKLIRYTDKHELIIRTFLPKVHKKLIKCNITPLIYTTKWFLQCFLDALPFSLVLRIWDIYLIRGDIVLLAMSYCILKMHKKTLLRKDYDMDKINEFLNHKLPDDFLFDDDIVIEKLKLCIERINEHKFESGPLIETIPENELPKIPFGQFKKFQKEEIVSKIAAQINSKEEIVKKMAKERLERAKTTEQTGADEDENDESIADSDDDLNPSKLSEYDEEKEDKKSVLSNLTHQSSNSTKYSSSISDYENVAKKYSTNSLKNQIKTPNTNKKLTSMSNAELVKQTSPSSKPSYVTSIKSNPPPVSPTTFLNESSNSTKSKHVTSIISNYHENKSPPQQPHQIKSPNQSDISNGSKSSLKYVRSPHGIYTRVIVPPDENTNYSRRSPTSFRLISDSVYATYVERKEITDLNDVNTSVSPTPSRRKSSFRNLNYSSGASVPIASNSNTPTKKQMEYHSILINSIQQKQNQSPEQITVSGSSMTSKKAQTSSPNRLPEINNKDIIEQYDFI